MTDDTATIARACMLLAVLVNEIRGLRNDLAGRKQSSKKPRGLSSSDVLALSEILPAVAAVFGEKEFTVGAMVTRSKECTPLRDAIESSGANSLQLGWLLKRAADAEAAIAGLHVHVIRGSRAGAVICIDATSRSHRIATGVATALRETLQK